MSEQDLSVDKEAEAEKLRKAEAEKAAKAAKGDSEDGAEIVLGVGRYDRGTVRKPRRDDSTGELLVEASVTRAPAVFSYKNADGTTRREFRPSDSVFSQDNLSRMSRGTVTLGHPPVRVTTKNVRKYGVGHADGNIRVDKNHAIVGLVVSDEEAIAAINSGVRELSCGYDCDLVMRPGVWTDESGTQHHYDAIQTNHRNNHHALCHQGRAGTARLLMDSLDRTDAIQIDGDEHMPAENTETKVRLRLDDTMEVELPSDGAKLVSDALKAKDAEIAKLKADSDKLEAERDDAKTKAEKAATELESATKADDMHEKVTARIELEGKAKPFFKADEWEAARVHADAPLKRATVAKARPEVSLDGKSDTYVEAAFDLLEAPTNGDATVKKLGSSLVSAELTGDEQTEVRKRVEDAMKRDEDGWRHTVPGGVTQDGKTIKPEPRMRIPG